MGEEERRRKSWKKSPNNLLATPRPFSQPAPGRSPRPIAVLGQQVVSLCATNSLYQQAVLCEKLSDCHSQNRGLQRQEHGARDRHAKLDCVLVIHICNVVILL